MGRRARHEEHQNHEAWAIPYGDLITLLLAFFVVMYAISSVNEGKYRVLSDALVAAFRGTPMTFEPVQVGQKQVGSGADIAMSIVRQGELEGQPRELMAPVPVRAVEVTEGRSGEANAPFRSQPPPDARAEEELDAVAQEIEAAMAELIERGMVAVRRREFVVEVEIRTDILFASGAATLTPEANAVIDRMAEVLAPFPNAVKVEGHTDDRPINTLAFPSNWELSAARAATVVHVMMKHGVAPGRLTVIGFGEHRPMQSNETPAGRNANRRVLLVIQASNPAVQAGAPALPQAPNG